MLPIKQLRKVILTLIALIAVGLTFDYFNVTRKERQLSAAVSACGGRMGSIPVWPLGTEYRITLPRVPDDKELRDLGIANKMRGWVGIAFQDVEIPIEGHQRLRSKLQNCHLFVVRDGTMKPLGHTEEQSDEPADATERRNRAL